MAEKIVKFQNWMGGISNDEYIMTQAGSFNDCFGIDIRSSSLSFQLGKGGHIDDLNLGVTATVGKPVASYSILAGGTEWHALSAGIIKNQSASTVYTKTGELSILNMVPYTITGGVGTTDLVLVGTTKVSRIKFGTPGTVSEDFATLTTPVIDNTSYRPAVLGKGGELLIGHGNKLDSIDSLGTLTNSLSFAKNEYVVQVMVFGDQIIIITQKSVYFWDGANSVPNRTLPLQGLTVIGAQRVLNTIYLITNDAFGGALYATSGSFYDLQKIYASNYSGYVNLGFVNGTNSTTVDGGVMYMPKASTGVYAYGLRTPGFPKSLTNDLPGVANSTDLIYFISGRAFIGGVSGSNSYVSRYNTNQYFSDQTNVSFGYAITQYVVGDMMSTKKQGVEFEIGFNLPSSNCTVQVSYRKDAETSFTSLETCTTAVYGTGYTRAILHFDEYFYRVQFKVQIVGTTSETPQVFNAKFNYNELELTV